MLTSHKVFSEVELRSRYEIQLENYVRTVRIEALTMAEMTKKDILPAITAYAASLSAAITAKKGIDPALACGYETKVVKRLSTLADSIDAATEELEKAVTTLDDLGDVTEESAYVRDTLLPKMAELRASCDEAETMTATSYWPFPTYGDLLFGV